MFHNFAKMDTATTGTGTLTLGNAMTGWLSFDDAGVVNGEKVAFVIEEGDEREISIGVYTTSGTTLTRDKVLTSTNSGSKISLNGDAVVFIALPAEYVLPANEYAPPNVQDDFFIFSTESGEIGQLCWQCSSSNTSINPAYGGLTDVSHPGILNLSMTGTGTTIIYVYQHGSGASIQPGMVSEMTWIMKLVPGTYDANFNVRFGFVGNIAVVTDTDGFYFERLAADSGIYGVVNSSSTKVRTAQLIADPSGWVKYKMRIINTNEIGFSVNDGTEEIIYNTSFPGNVISQLDYDNDYLGICMKNNSISYARTCLLDYFQLKLRPVVR